MGYLTRYLQNRNKGVKKEGKKFGHLDTPKNYTNETKQKASKQWNKNPNIIKQIKMGRQSIRNGVSKLRGKRTKLKKVF